MATQEISQRKAIPQSGQFPKLVVEWDLPEGISPTDVQADHCMPDLVMRWNEEWKHVQMIDHRSFYSFGDHRHENSFSAKRATYAAGRHTTEDDVAYTRDGKPIDLHDLSFDRVTDYSGPTNTYDAKEIVGQALTIGIPEGGIYRGATVRTNDVVWHLVEKFYAALEINPHASFFVDTRESDSGRWIAQLSHHPELYKRCATIVYTFKYKNGGHLIDDVLANDPHPGWAQNVGLISMIYADELSKLADYYELPKSSADDLCAAGSVYVQSFAFPARDDVKLKMLGWSMMKAGLSMADFTPVEVQSMTAEERAAVHACEACEMLEDYIYNDVDIRAEHPHFRLGTGTRTYNFSSLANGVRKYYSEDLFTGQPIAWKDGILGDIKKRYATPGVALANARSTYTITDRVEDEIVLSPCCPHLAMGRTASFHYPPLDLDQ